MLMQKRKVEKQDGTRVRAIAPPTTTTTTTLVVPPPQGDKGRGGNGGGSGLGGCDSVGGEW